MYAVENAFDLDAQQALIRLLAHYFEVRLAKLPVLVVNLDRPLRLYPQAGLELVLAPEQPVQDRLHMLADLVLNVKGMLRIAVFRLQFDIRLQLLE